MRGLRALGKKLETIPLRDIVLDRPHIELWEMRDAVQMAQRHGYKVKVCLTTTPWAKSWQKCATRTKHKIAPTLFAQMAADFEPGVSPAKILRSLTPFAKLERCEELWNRMETETGTTRAATWKEIRTRYPKELTRLIERHGLLKPHGWPKTAGDVEYLKPLNA